MNSTNNPSRFSEQDIESVRTGFSNEHGRYIALMDLSHFLSNDNVDTLLPASEVLSRPISGIPGPLNPSMVELPTTSRNVDLSLLAPPAPPLPRMMKNLLKDRRRFQRQFVTSTVPPPIDVDSQIVASAHKALENYQLNDMFKNDLEGKTDMDVSEFSRELLFSAISDQTRNDESGGLLKPEMEFKLKK